MAEVGDYLAQAPVATGHLVDEKGLGVAKRAQRARAPAHMPEDHQASIFEKVEKGAQGVIDRGETSQNRVKLHSLEAEHLLTKPGHELVRGANASGRRREAEHDGHVNSCLSHGAVEVLSRQVRVVVAIGRLPMVVELVAPVLGLQAVRMDINDHETRPVLSSHQRFVLHLKRD
jgi:hypothetical protein